MGTVVFSQRLKSSKSLSWANSIEKGRVLLLAGFFRQFVNIAVSNFCPCN